MRLQGSKIGLLMCREDLNLGGRRKRPTRGRQTDSKLAGWRLSAGKTWISKWRWGRKEGCVLGTR
jgi:hypothetical protein